MHRKLYILGTGGLAREMAMLVEQINSRDARWEFAGFITHDRSEIGKNLGLGKIVGDDCWLLEQRCGADIVVGVGSPALRQKVLEQYLLHKERFSFPNLVHPSANVDAKWVTLGVGNAITAGCIFTCDIKVRDFNIFNLNVTVGHDCEIGSFNVLNPCASISGSVTIGDSVLLGTGCQILQGLTLGSGATIGAGAMVRKHVDGNQTVVGVPAAPLPPRSRSL